MNPNSRWPALSGSIALTLILLMLTGCKPPKDSSVDQGKMASNTNEEMTSTHQNTVRISPEGTTALVDLGNDGSAWYALPSGKLLHRHKDYSGVDVLDFAVGGLNWIQEGKEIVFLSPEGEQQVMPLPGADGRWRCFRVAPETGLVAAVVYREGRTTVRIYRWPGGGDPIARLEVPKMDRNVLKTNSNLSLLYVHGENQGSVTPQEQLITFREGALTMARGFEEDLHSLPAFNREKVTYGIRNYIVVIEDPNGDDRHIGEEGAPENPSIASFAGSGKSVLAITPLESLPNGGDKFLVRLVALADGKVSARTEVEVPHFGELFTDKDDELYSISLDNQGKPIITLQQWQ